MAGFDHETNANQETERPETVARNTRYGIILFAVYLALYGTYVFVNAFAPEVMEQAPLGGVNLAILSGFGLIAAAFLLALVYGWLCRLEASSDDQEGFRA